MTDKRNLFEESSIEDLFIEITDNQTYWIKEQSGQTLNFSEFLSEYKSETRGLHHFDSFARYVIAMEKARANEIENDKMFLKRNTDVGFARILMGIEKQLTRIADAIEKKDDRDDSI